MLGRRPQIKNLVTAVPLRWPEGSPWCRAISPSVRGIRRTEADSTPHARAAARIRAAAPVSAAEKLSLPGHADMYVHTSITPSHQLNSANTRMQRARVFNTCSSSLLAAVTPNFHSMSSSLCTVNVLRSKWIASLELPAVHFFRIAFAGACLRPAS